MSFTAKKTQVPSLFPFLFSFLRSSLPHTFFVTGPAVLLVHGLFVNADHWRKNLPILAEAGCRAYAIDLLGNGYSSKPPPCAQESRALSGENGRSEVASGLLDVELGTASGGVRRSDVALAHPLGSVYNFYTWAEQLTEFTQEVIQPQDGRAIIVCNSIGTISSLQAAIDRSVMYLTHILFFFTFFK